MTPPLILGLFHGSTCRVRPMESRRVRALAAEAVVQGASLGLFGTTDIDFASETVRYTRLTPEGWTAWRGPMPDVILQDGPQQEDADCPAAERLRTLVPFVGRPLPDRLTLSETLRATALAPHVIPFRRVAAPDAGEVLASFLDTHKRAVLKPASEMPGNSGSTGRGALFIASDGDDIVVRQNGRHWRSPRKDGLAQLAGLIGDRPWILQKMIISRVGDGRVFVVRVHIHNTGSGRWALVRSFVGLSEAGSLVTNTSRGGLQGGLGKVLAGLGDEGAALEGKIHRLGFQIGEALDAQGGGGYDELEAEILIDPDHRPWIAELNSRPVTPFHELVRARHHVAYACRLARRPGPGADEAARHRAPDLAASP